jgi:hypothetical protein
MNLDLNDIIDSILIGLLLGFFISQYLTTKNTILIKYKDKIILSNFDSESSLVMLLFHSQSSFVFIFKI